MSIAPDSSEAETVLQHKSLLGPDGTLTVPIDTSLTKELYSNRDHRYTLTVEVTDSSRRTIRAQGDVLVGRQHFKVHVWADRGHYEAGDTLQLSIKAQTITGGGVEAQGFVALHRIAAGEEMPTGLELPVSTNSLGEAHLPFTAPESGQYRATVTLTDAQGRSQIGGYFLTVLRWYWAVAVDSGDQAQNQGLDGQEAAD